MGYAGVMHESSELLEVGLLARVVGPVGCRCTQSDYLAAACEQQQQRTTAQGHTRCLAERFPITKHCPPTRCFRPFYLLRTARSSFHCSCACVGSLLYLYTLTYKRGTAHQIGLYSAISRKLVDLDYRGYLIYVFRKQRASAGTVDIREQR